jgi:uncharacterized integral membrane protein
MKHLLWLLKWVLKVAIFFTLFAFALNNQQDTSVHFFFGKQWQAPQVLVVLSAFSIGVVVGVLGMLPHWFKRRSSKVSVQTVVQSPATAVQAQPGLPGYVDGI